MPAVSRNIEKFFFIYLILTPVLDILSGAYIHVGSKIVGENLTDLITPTLIIRMFILLLFAFYILSLRDRKSILTILPIGIAWLATLAGEFLFTSAFSLFAEIRYMARFGYNILALLVYWRLFKRCFLSRAQLLEWLNKYISLTLLVLSLSIHIPYILGLGYSTYADRFGTFGARGFFYSGNDITAVLMMLIPIAIVNYTRLPRAAERRRHLFYLAAPAAALTALFSIGTKTAFIAFGVTVLVLGIYFWRHAKLNGDKTAWRAFIYIMIAFLILFIFLSLFGLVKDLIDAWGHFGDAWFDYDGDWGKFFSSERIDKMRDTRAVFVAGGPFAWLFGIGRGTQPFTIEMDVYEVLFYYGTIGALTMLWLYVKLGIGIIRRFIPRRREAYALAAFLSVGLTAAYSVLAGHVLFSVTSGFYFAFMLLYSYLYYAKNKEEFSV